MGKDLFGEYYVKPTASAIRDAQDLFPKYGDYQEARKHALKLAFWPGAEAERSGLIVDLDWEWIQALRTFQIGELRIQDSIGGNRNLRVVFWVADKLLTGDSMKRIWTLAVVNKKSNDWTNPELKAFEGRYKILKLRKYS